MASSNLINNVNWIIKGRLEKAFKRLRKDYKYRCRMNVSGYCDITKADKYLFFKKPTLTRARGCLYKIWTPIEFCYSGDLDLIEGILESEGLTIGYHCIYPNTWFCIQIPEYKELWPIANH